VGSAGNADFNQALERLVLGEDIQRSRRGGVRTIQAPGGCGALRLGAELIRTASPESVVHVSTPTWVNHVPLLSGSGVQLERYPYFDPTTGGVKFDAMLAALEKLSARAVVLLHASCHNPTGADLTEGRGGELLTLFKQRQLAAVHRYRVPGLGSGVAQQHHGPRRQLLEGGQHGVELHPARSWIEVGIALELDPGPESSGT